MDAHVAAANSLEFLLVLGGGYLLLLATSGFFVRGVYWFIDGESVDDQSKARRDAGWVIGKCENILGLTFILSGAFTALAVIFAAKGIVSRDSEADESYSRYILLGTIANFTYTVVFGVVIRMILITDLNKLLA